MQEINHAFTNGLQGSLTFDYIPYINFAMVTNRRHAVIRCVVQNDSPTPMQDITITLTGDAVAKQTYSIDLLPAGRSIDVTREIGLLPNVDEMMRLTEARDTSFTITVSVGANEALDLQLPLRLMTYDQWLGLSEHPEMLAAFVMPNHPMISRVISKASGFMQTLSGSSTLDEYQSGDANRVRQQVAAVYEALRSEGITYVTSKASFEDRGQRIRTVDKVLNEKLGTCLDLSVLYASVLEAIGINPLLVLVEGHAFIGAWLVPSMGNMVGDDASYLLKNSADGINDLVLVETTMVASSGAPTFDDAVKAAMAHLKNEDQLRCYINVAECRYNGIRPIAMRQSEGESWTVINEGDKHDNATTNLKRVDRYDLSAYDSKSVTVTKYTIWERKLLDFSLRNNLLNMKLGKRIIPIVSFAIDELEDELQAGESFRVLPFPLDEKADTADSIFDSSKYPQLEAPITQQLKKHCIFSFHRQNELTEALKYAYRSSRTSLEENGANNLYLVIGVLRWYESEASRQPRYAPLLLLPIEMIRGSRGAGYTIRARDEDTALNITLTEMLKQQHEIDLSVLNVLPTDASGVDVKKIFAIVRDKIRDKRRWNVIDEAMIGLFSFNKFVMWNDIHSNSALLHANPIIASLVEGRLNVGVDCKPTDAKEADKRCRPEEFTIPIDVDSSQLEAIIDSGAGQSFILHGPPGTGKSQTITNMIANALYQGKRVLFVAEKMAALSVVQSRLEKIGLAPFCLELHSNKVTKQHFLQQMDMALNVAHGTPSKSYKEEADQLYAKRVELMNYVDALHAKHLGGISLYDCISGYLATPGDTMKVDITRFPDLSKAGIDEISSLLNHLDMVFKVAGNPAGSDLEGLTITNGTGDAEQLLHQQLEQADRLYSMLPNEQVRATVKVISEEWDTATSKWFLPRFFAKRSVLSRHGITETDISNIAQILQCIDRINTVARIDVAPDEIPAALKRWKDAHTDMRHWYMWCKERETLLSRNLNDAVDYILTQGRSGAEAANAFAKGVYHALGKKIIDSNEQLRYFNGQLFDDVIEKYRDLTARFQELSKKELYCRLASKVPSMAMAAHDSSEVGIIKRNIKNHGRGTSIRKIIDQIPTLLPKLCPCMLMSPLSVAQYIDLNNDKFDLVIFDEASQMPTSEAVGAIARGKALIVVGDPKQMPPTSFFSTANVGEEEADLDDMESILDDCLAMSIPSKYLSWHYRSKHESLIAFSNAQYYGGNLLTFPSVDDQKCRVSMRYIDGVYQRSGARVNLPEAKAVVDEVIHRLSDPELMKYSIGIVSFSKVQQDKIEDLLTDELSKHPDLESRAYECAEPIFIKNLENVQGDERDVILFSVGYGPDTSGKVSMNFGPLNKAGGERRLNVAVSRARYEMVVFSSLRSDDIDMRRTDALGVEGLKKFIEYAETGRTSMMANNASAIADSYIAQMISDRLNERGYETRLGVGRSQFKIDIAVVDPADPNKYMLGIMLDGEIYNATKTVRDREIVQPSVLRMLHWNVMRIWTLDWYERPDQVIDTIVERIKAIQSGKVTPEKKTDNTKEPQVKIVEDKVESVSPAFDYKFTKKFSVRPLSSADEITSHAQAIMTQLKTIVATEQPILSSLLYKRIVKIWGLTRVSPKVQTLVDSVLRDSQLYSQPEGDTTRVWWSDPDKPEVFKGFRVNSDRDIQDVPMIEVVNAMSFVIDQQVAIERDDLKRLTANQLGFTRMGINIDIATDAALTRLIDSGYVTANASKIIKA